MSIVAIMLAIIEIVVIWFLTSQNKMLFKVGTLADLLSSCMSVPYASLKTWHFGFDNLQGFHSVLFVNTVFILIYLSALGFDRCVFEPYQRN